MLSSITVPPSCLTQTWVSTPPGGVGTGLVIGNPYDPACWPVGLGTTASPAACPTGYHSACTPSNLLIPSETVYDCCPNGYSCDGGFFACTSAFGSMINVTATNLDSNQKPVAYRTSTDGMNAHSIRVRHASSDLITTSATAAPSSSGTGAGSGPTPSSTTSVPAPTGTTDPGNSAGGLSTGAKAGIGAGVGGAAVVALGVAAWLFLRRRARAKVDRPAELGNSPMVSPGRSAAGGGGGGVLYEQSPGMVSTPYKPPSEPPSELGGHGMHDTVHEMGTDDHRSPGHDNRPRW